MELTKIMRPWLLRILNPWRMYYTFTHGEVYVYIKHHSLIFFTNLKKISHWNSPLLFFSALRLESVKFEEFHQKNAWFFRIFSFKLLVMWFKNVFWRTKWKDLWHVYHLKCFHVKGQSNFLQNWEFWDPKKSNNLEFSESKYEFSLEKWGLTWRSI